MPHGPCRHPRCPNRSTCSSMCELHQRQYERDRRHRQNHGALYGSARWKSERAAYLALPENRWCAYCRRGGVQVPAQCVDLRIPAKGNPKIFWDKSGWIPACLNCNRKKAAATEGSFGRMDHDASNWG